MSKDATHKFRKPFERLSNVDEVELIEVIRVMSIVGQGDGEGSPIRSITEYFSKDGERLARVDPVLGGELKMGVWTAGDDE